MVHTTTHRFSTRGQGDAHDVTDLVARATAGSGVQQGIATVFVVGSTAGMTTIEFEAGAIGDVGAVLEQLAPRDGEYRHHLKWNDDNGSSHVRAALVGPSVTIPIVGGRLALGTWQQIALLEFDTRPRQRDVIVQVVGDA